MKRSCAEDKKIRNKRRFVDARLRDRESLDAKFKDLCSSLVGTRLDDFMCV